MRKDPLVRFQSHVTIDPCGCHSWDGAHNKRGYAEFSVPRLRLPGKRGGNMRVRAARWLFIHTHGPIPAGYEVDHKCRNAGCVNIDHLQAITKEENLALRGVDHL